MTTSTAPAKKPVRRRASRAAGPASGSTATTAAVKVDKPKTTAKTARKVGPPPRRPAHRARVALVSLVTGFVAIAAVGAAVAVMLIQQRDAHAVQQRHQRFVDTAAEMVVNMSTFTPDTIDDSVNRFYNSTSGPLHDQLSRDNNVENLKAFLRATQLSAEAKVTSAALEEIDEVNKQASVLVAVRTTGTDMDGVNQPSQPYRFRVIVREDDQGRMTGYDLNYPGGGN